MIAVSSNGKSCRALAISLAAGRSGQERDRVEVPVYHLTISFDPQEAAARGAEGQVPCGHIGSEVQVLLDGLLSP
jgi:hypothetical protein